MGLPHPHSFMLGTCEKPGQATDVPVDTRGDVFGPAVGAGGVLTVPPRSRERDGGLKAGTFRFESAPASVGEGRQPIRVSVRESRPENAGCATRGSAVPVARA